jgi:hypothetical protein
MGVKSVSAPGNVKQAIGDLLIELEGDAHQIKYKPTQHKNSKAEKMFPGIPTGLCSEGIMHSIRHSLKNCEKTLCNAKEFLIKANMDWYQLPPVQRKGILDQSKYGLVSTSPPGYEWIFQASYPSQNN